MMIMAMMKQNEAAGPLKRNEAAEPLKQSEAAEPLEQSEAAEPLTFFLTHDACLPVKHPCPCI